jgi:hypothetical protein
MPYQWDSIPSYRLQYTIVNKFLMELFGNYDFYTQVNSSQCLISADNCTTSTKYARADGLT